jgi:hypothetical protein
MVLFLPTLRISSPFSDDQRGGHCRPLSLRDDHTLIEWSFRHASIDVGEAPLRVINCPGTSPEARLLYL